MVIIVEDVSRWSNHQTRKHKDLNSKNNGVVFPFSFTLTYLHIAGWAFSLVQWGFEPAGNKMSASGVSRWNYFILLTHAEDEGKVKPDEQSEFTLVELHSGVMEGIWRAGLMQVWQGQREGQMWPTAVNCPGEVNMEGLHVCCNAPVLQMWK